MVACTATPRPAYAQTQTAAPSQLTPQSLRPENPAQPAAIDLSSPAPVLPPAGVADLDVWIDGVQIDGAFVEHRRDIDSLVAAFGNTRVTVGQIYAFAAAIETRYAQAGFPLVRVTVPPQQLVDHGTLRIQVIDGFIEAIDVDRLPIRVRGVVAARLKYLVHRPHLKLREIERALLLAGAAPGLTLRSTLSRGTSEGGATLVLEGKERPVSGSLGGDNQLGSSLGSSQLRAGAALNSLFGAGEQLYFSGGSTAHLNQAFVSSSPLSVYGGGLAIPLGNDGLTLNPEYTHSRTLTLPEQGLLASIGTFERIALRVQEPWILTRARSLNLTLSLEQVRQQLGVPEFRVDLNRDRYGVVRLEPDFVESLHSGATLQTGASLSRGLGGRDQGDAAASGVSLTRQGAEPNFNKVSANAHLDLPLSAVLHADVTALAQSAFGRPMLRSEQFALDGVNAVSGFADGTLAVDEGATVRAEFCRSFAARWAKDIATASPYLFAATGRGALADATRVEQKSITATSFGLGARGSLKSAGPAGMSIGIELSRQYTDLAGVREGWNFHISSTGVF